MQGIAQTLNTSEVFEVGPPGQFVLLSDYGPADTCGPADQGEEIEAGEEISEPEPDDIYEVRPRFYIGAKLVADACEVLATRPDLAACCDVERIAETLRAALLLIE